MPELPPSYPPTPLTARLASGAQLVIAGLWVWAGIDKLFDLGTFEEAVRHHGVIGDRLTKYLVAVPTAEVVLGCCVAVFGATRVGRWVPLCASVIVIVGFSAYLLTIPAHVIKAFGCGCGGAAAQLAAESRAGAAFRNGLFLLLHVIALVPGREPGKPGTSSVSRSTESCIGSGSTDVPIASNGR